MKFTKAQLKHFIKEELANYNEADEPGPAVGGISSLAATSIPDDAFVARQIDPLVAKLRHAVRKVVALYDSLPEEAKPYFIQNLKMYIDRWSEEGLQEVLRVRNPGLEDKVIEIRGQLGDELFFKELVNLIPDETLSSMVRKIAKDKKLTVGGVQHI